MKRILITGATRGLGLAIAQRLVSDGFQVLGTARACTDELRKLMAAHEGQVVFAPFDMEDTGEIHAFLGALTKAHGHLYGLVNNAALGADGVLGTMHNTDIERTLRVNVAAPMILTKYALRSMMMGGAGGRVVNVSSITATRGFSGLSVYSATKAALEGFTRSLSRELGRAKITVNAVAPGFMETEMTLSLKGEKLEKIKRRSPMRTLAGVTDAAGAVSYLLGPDAALVTGTVLTVDAGSTA